MTSNQPAIRKLNGITHLRNILWIGLSRLAFWLIIVIFTLIVFSMYGGDITLILERPATVSLILKAAFFLLISPIIFGLNIVYYVLLFNMYKNYLFPEHFIRIWEIDSLFVYAFVITIFDILLIVAIGYFVAPILSVIGVVDISYLVSLFISLILPAFLIWLYSYFATKNGPKESISK